MTKSRAGCVMCGDHPEFRAGLQTISMKHKGACNFWRLESALNSKFADQERRYSKISAVDEII